MDDIQERYEYSEILLKANIIGVTIMDKSKIGKKSKRKGKKYEARIAFILSEFTGMKFRRVPSSGGFNKTGGQVILENVFSGDVICEDRAFAFSVEAKNRKDISLTALLKNPKTASLTRYWKQCVDDSKASNLKPLMFFKPNVNDDWACLPIDVAISLGLAESNHLKVEVFKDIELPNMFIVDWHEFIKIVDPGRLFEDEED